MSLRELAGRVQRRLQSMRALSCRGSVALVVLVTSLPAFAEVSDKLPPSDSYGFKVA